MEGEGIDLGRGWFTGKNFRGGGGILPGEFIGMDQGETLHIQKREIVFVLEKGYVVYEKKRNQFALILFSD